MPLLISADGVHSTVARVLGRRSSREVVRALGAELRMAPAMPGMVELVVDRELLPGWFAWSIPLGPDRVRVGVGTTADIPPARLLAALRGLFAAQFAAEPEPGSYSAGLIQLWAPGNVINDGVMLVGDAAGQVKPSTGGGIHSGLVGAHHAARQAVHAHARGAFDRGALRDYERRWHVELGSEFRNLNSLRSIYVRLGQRRFKALVGAFGHPALGRIIAEQGDIDFPSHMFGSLVRAAPSLLALAGGRAGAAPAPARLRGRPATRPDGRGGPRRRPARGRRFHRRLAGCRAIFV
ncbi:MAG: NAD(P)/FAD-dependent oxidoreductase [Dehalococcoidia bacterium]|nr:NAD(P)/FAD-dependent oxidoreductase [Dehalococcoidia bacterium]